jgi:ribosome-associated protein
VQSVEISGDDIRLGQLLKLTGAVDAGAHVKLLLAEGRVQVNGEVELRRGRRLVRKDVVALDGQEFVVA